MKRYWHPRVEEFLQTGLRAGAAEIRLLADERAGRDQTVTGRDYAEACVAHLATEALMGQDPSVPVDQIAEAKRILDAYLESRH